MSLLFDTLCRFFRAFLPSKEQVYFSFVAAVKVHGDFEAQENTATVSTFPSSICHEVLELDAMTVECLFVNSCFEC